VFAGDVLVVRDGRCPHLIPHRAAASNNHGISGDGAAGELPAGFEQGEHHTVVVEQPEVVSRQVIGVDVLAG
jgi:hypothetical protein